jgi:hypothetical protein
MIKAPKNTDRYYWTQHVYEKMGQYQISEQMIKRVIRSPKRVEKGIAPKTIAVMQPRGKKKKHELWVMYQQTKLKFKDQDTKLLNRIKIITAWRVPGISPIRETIPIPENILDELSDLL